MILHHPGPHSDNLILYHPSPHSDNLILYHPGHVGPSDPGGGPRACRGAVRVPGPAPGLPVQGNLPTGLVILGLLILGLLILQC